MSPHVFISYVRENSATVDRISSYLRAKGVTVWVDRDSISPGQYWKDAISDAISEGAFFIACYSKELALRKESFMHGELRLAIDRLRTMPRERVWFIPVLLDSVEIPKHRISEFEWLSDINALNLFDDFESGMRIIANVIQPPNFEYRRAQSIIQSITEDISRSRELFKALAEVGVIPVGGLETILRGTEFPDDEIRAVAFEALGMIDSDVYRTNSDRINASLIAGVRQGNRSIKINAIEAIMNIFEGTRPDLLVLISNSLDDDDEFVRNTALRALEEGDSVPESIFMRVRELAVLDDPNYNALRLLGRIPNSSESDIRILLRHVDHKESIISYSALEALRQKLSQSIVIREEIQARIDKVIEQQLLDGVTTDYVVLHHAHKVREILDPSIGKFEEVGHKIYRKQSM